MRKKNIRVRIAVLCGGPSSERDVSIRSGKNIAQALSGHYHPLLVTLPREKHLIPARIERLRGTCDLALIALHGAFGEDGVIQAILKSFDIPYTGSGVLASALGMDKAKTYGVVRAAGIHVPEWRALRRRDSKKTIFAQARVIGYPCVVKPNASGSSVGVSIVRHERELPRALIRAFREDHIVLLQKYIVGRELTCGVLGNTGQTKLLALPPVEIAVAAKTFFDYHAKYFSKATQELCPAPVQKAVTTKITTVSRVVHALLGCDGLTRSDFILDRRGKLYFLEINTIPGMTEASLCPKEAKALGWSFPKFLEKIIQLALLKSKT